MPPKSRTGRPTFGGNLLAVPTPLPDDDDAPPSEDLVGEEPSSPVQPVDQTPVPEPVPPQPHPTTASPDTPDSARPASPTPNRSTRERPPSTIRLDDRAGRELWDAYVKAKTQDPFLSYRQFASGVVLDGLATQRRREKRSP